MMERVCLDFPLCHDVPTSFQYREFFFLSREFIEHTYTGFEEASDIENTPAELDFVCWQSAPEPAEASPRASAPVLMRNGHFQNEALAAELVKSLQCRTSPTTAPARKDGSAWLLLLLFNQLRYFYLWASFTFCFFPKLWGLVFNLLLLTLIQSLKT